MMILRILALVALALASRAGWAAPAAPSLALSRARDSVNQATNRAQADPTRPIYHFHAPAQWMNDPNGPIYYRGFYHMFYQFNPYLDEWGTMHWGHAKSRDMVHWQHLPIALSPAEELGEEHVFSGCTVLPPKGPPTIFYTSIKRGRSAETYAEQWAAQGDNELLNWHRLASNPVLSEGLHGDRKIYDWRDPFVFQHRGITYMVLGGNLNQRQGGQAVVNLYQAENDQLTQWRYLGILFQHPDPKVVNIECPNFFELGNRWVLIVSPHGPVEYFVGTFDVANHQFQAQYRSTFDASDNFYAPNSCVGPRGHRLLWGWIKGFPPGHGWNGTLTLPRVLSMEGDGHLRQRPDSEIHKLRTDHFQLSDVALESPLFELPALQGDAMEFYADVELMSTNSVQLQLRRSADGKRSIPITFNGSELEVAGTKAPFCLLANEKTLQLQVFLDKSTLEVFGNGRVSITKVINAPLADLGVALVAPSGDVRLRSFHAWKMQSSW